MLAKCWEGPLLIFVALRGGEVGQKRAEKAWQVERKEPTSHFYNMANTEFYDSYSSCPRDFRQARNSSPMH